MVIHRLFSQKGNQCDSAHICQNGGTCSPSNNGVNVCTCPFGYLGRYCQIAPSCFSNPCKNDSICVIDYWNNYVCTTSKINK